MPQTRKQASIRARQDANQGRQDEFGTDKAEVEFEDSFTAIESAAGDLIKRVHDNAEKKKMVVTGEMFDIQVQRVEGGVEITAPKHLLYQDRGINGAVVKLYDTPYSYKDKMPPVESLQAWADAKGVNVYALQRTIFKKGIEPQHILTPELDRFVEDVVNEIADFTAEQITFNL